MEKTNNSVREDVLLWIENGCDFSAGCQLYSQYGTNTVLKMTLFIPQKNFKAINVKLLSELCSIAGIPVDPLDPESVKKKSSISLMPIPKENQIEDQIENQIEPENQTETQMKEVQQILSENQTSQSLQDKSSLPSNKKSPSGKTPRKKNSSTSSAKTSKNSPTNSKS